MAKSALTKEEIAHLGKLAALDLTEKEIEMYREQLSKTLDYVKNLDELDVKSVTPTSQTTDLHNVSFEDGEKCERMLTKDEALKNSKKKDGNYFVVKKIL